MRSKDCPAEHDLRSYLQRESESNQFAAIATHLVGCRSCRLDLLNWQRETAGVAEQVSVPPGLKRRVARMGTRRTSFFPGLIGWAGSPSFAVAVLVLIAVTAGGLWQFVNNAGPNPNEGDPLRAGSRRAPSLSPTSPTENAVVSTPTIVFNWTSDTEVIRYTVLVLDESGDIVYQAGSPAGPLTVEISQTQLLPQKRYFWHVRAKLPDGTELETKPVPFSLKSK